MSSLCFACSAACSSAPHGAKTNGDSGVCAPRVSRRGLLHLAGAVVAAAVVPRQVDATPLYGKPSTSELLHRMDRERSEEEIAAEREARAEARRLRLEKQRALEEEASRKRAEGTVAQNDSAEIEANLRANYYYPTARKRYLPRVKRATEDIPRVASAVKEGRWAEVSKYLDGSLDDLVLPMKLYASSLAGQGLSLAAKFVQNMSDSAEDVDKSLKSLKKAAKRKDSSSALAYLADIEKSISSYRANGKLEAPDFGIGEVPKDAKVGSGLGNNNPALYNRNFAEAGLRSPQS